ncbi:MAG: UvrD-helicase domain-containing protein, partial [Planctomycetes bacterium]|nr:UvrD-helicase domain-containing protein [Planctomycetota bacterium]
MTIPDANARTRAATDLTTNLVVTAGAGTGKTSLIIERVLYQLLAAGRSLEKLAVITFTEKAAAELRDRLEEALEGILDLTTHGNNTEKDGEASRVFARLTGPQRVEATAHARTALEALDRATVSTIHSFAADMLRRHHSQAGVDPLFEIDAEGLAFEELFREHWEQFIERSLSDDEPPPEWEKILKRFRLDEVETMALQLSAFHISSATIARSEAHIERAYASAYSSTLLTRLSAVRDRVMSVNNAHEMNANFRTSLTTLDAELQKTVADGSLPDEKSISCLIQQPKPGAKLALPDASSLSKELKSIRDGALRLARSDLNLSSDLSQLLGQFVHGFRRDYLASGWISHDATIRLTRDLLRDHRRVRRFEAERYDHILIDEFQDTDPLQYEIAFFLGAQEAATAAEEKHDASDDPFALPLVPGKLFIVGDAKQSIYRFRGADIDAYHRTVERIRGNDGDVLHLQTNFRSVAEVIDPLNDLFAGYFDEHDALDPKFHSLHARRATPSEPAIEVWTVGEPNLRAQERRSSEATAIAGWIRGELDAGRASPKEVAVLLRALPEVEVLLRAFRRYGVPYVVEGGRGFYQRYEVELLLACLRMVQSPADPVPLIACLRSPLGGVPDLELQRYATDTPDRDQLWSVDAKVDAKRYPALAKALSAFREFRDTHHGERLDRIAQAALDKLPLRLSVAASYEGAQRVANVEKAVRHVAMLADDGRWTDEAILDRIEREDARQNQEADSPLADETIEAVRVMSIHKSKGLEWPVVVVPDLAREHRHRDGFEPQVGATSPRAHANLPEALRLRIGSLETPSHLWHAASESDQDLAEAKRLLYVATTRARDRLVLIVGGSREVLRGRCPWVDALTAWRYEPEHAFKEDETTSLVKTIRHTRKRKTPSTPESARRTRSPAALLSAAEQYTAALETIRSETLHRLSGPSKLGEFQPSSTRGTEHEDQKRDDVTQTAMPQNLGRLVGTALHLLLEAWDNDDIDWLSQNAGRAVSVALCHDSTHQA